VDRPPGGDYLLAEELISIIYEERTTSNVVGSIQRIYGTAPLRKAE
jgi:hypothetical protein